MRAAWCGRCAGWCGRAASCCSSTTSPPRAALRWWAERTLAPLSRVLGWHPDFVLGDLLDDPQMAAEIVPCPPFGLFTLVRVPQPA